MPLFAYTGQNAASGKKVKATIEADSIKDAKMRLRKQNIYVVDISLDTKGQAATAGGGSFLDKLTRKPPKVEDLSVATKQFAILVRSAVDISEALKAISEQVENKELRSIYVKIRELVSEGKSLSDAHREFPKVFPPIYTNMIAAAEKAGALAVVLRRLSEFMTWQIAIKRKIVGALTYPAIMIVVALGVTIFLFVNVLPKITKAFASLKVTLPWYSIMLNNVSAWMQQYWHISLGVIALIAVAVLSWQKTPKGRYQIDKFLYSAPVVGDVVQRVAVSRFSKTLATVLSSGVRIVEGLQLTRAVVGNAVLEESIDEAIQRVQDGEKLAAALERTGRFPVMVVHMMRTGEKTGKLEEMLGNIAEAYDEEVDHKISSTTKIIEPFMMIFMAGFSLIEIIIVLGILGTLIAVLIGNIGGGAEKAKVKATAVKAGQVQQNLLKFQSDVGKMPTTAEGLGVLMSNPGTGKWSGPYGSDEDYNDDWGNAFEYELTPKGAKLTSPGIDGQVGTEDDLVFVGGRQVETQTESAPAQ